MCLYLNRNQFLYNMVWYVNLCLSIIYIIYIWIDRCTYKFYTYINAIKKTIITTCSEVCGLIAFFVVPIWFPQNYKTHCCNVLKKCLTAAMRTSTGCIFITKEDFLQPSFLITYNFMQQMLSLIIIPPQNIYNSLQVNLQIQLTPNQNTQPSAIKILFRLHYKK